MPSTNSIFICKGTTMKLFQNYLLSLIVFLVSFYTVANAQRGGGATGAEPDPLEVKIFPPSPNTASLGKYGEVPVGLYTGIPQISIPLTSIQDGSLSLPISLSYHAGGVRVEEIASWVGLGWSLNAGGVITRQVRGIPDEFDMERRSNILGILRGGQTSIPLMQDAIWGSRDIESDLYIYNINGISGTFFFGENNEILFTNKQDFKVEKVDNYASAWILTDASGNKYYFGSTKDGSRSAIEFATSTLSDDNGRSIISAWYITEIEDVTENSKIEFNYRIEQSQSQYRSGEKYTKRVESLDCGSNGFGFKRYSTGSSAETPILESIVSKHQKVEFTANFERDDLNSMLNGGGNAANALTKIIVSNNNNEPIKEFDLSYSYFASAGLSQYDGVFESDLQRSKKLRLDKIQESNEGLHLPPHIFQYNSLPLPERFSCQMDFWGFYNGRRENDGIDILTLIPKVEVYFPGVSDVSVVYDKGANRLPSQEYMKAGILEKIIYPTGGFTEFEYEANTTTDIDKFPLGYRNEHVYKSETMNVIEDNLNPITEQIFEINDVPEPSQGIHKTTLYWNISELNCSDGFGTLTCGVEVRIESLTDPTFIPFIIRQEAGYVQLQNGTYKLICNIVYDEYPTQVREFSINYNWEEGIYTQEKMAGGLRIKEIKSYANEFSDPIVKQYEYKAENGTSSGKMASELRNVKSPSYFPFCRGWGFTLSSSSHYPIVSTQGGQVGYKRVTTYTGLNKELGKVVNNYSFTEDILVEHELYEQPFAITSYESHRGQLLSTESYSKDDSDEYHLLSQTTNNYEEGGTKQVLNIKIERVLGSGASGTAAYVNYQTISSWQRLYSTTQKTYDPNNSQLLKEQTTNYFYNEDARHTLPIRTETIVDGKTLITYTKYPLDYGNVLPTSDNVSKGIYYLQDKNVVGAAVETYTTELDNSTNQEKTISAQRMVYNSDKPHLKEIHQLEANSAVSDDGIVNFIPSFINAQGEFLSDSRYEKRLEYYKYDEFGNPLEFGKVKDVHKSYIWGYKNTYPIAEVINASQDQIFHTSFEEEGGNSSEARTGTKSFKLLDFINVKDNLPRGKYLFSVWVKGKGTITVLDKTKTFNSPNEWLHIEFRLETETERSIVIIGSGSGQDGFLIDEVRLHPLEAHMITRTYTPLIGVTSETNVNHNSTFYEYDELQRLHIIRDQEGNIIKRTDYEYKGN
ncbi:hypothetical protein ACE193_23165 [Bernardetia sp. OM2101]|uniref:hypothetical protein n=1 Tax=Bernardetia sp. OM2101 TaxID=3344876 RepID=UPI0035D09BF2